MLILCTSPNFRARVDHTRLETPEPSVPAVISRSADLASPCPALTSTEQRLLAPGQIRRSELIAGLSAALDMTEGQPVGHSARSTLIAMELGRRISLPDEDLAALYYGVLLKDLGCSSNSAKMAYLFGGDERVVKRDVKTVDWVKVASRAKFAASHVAPGGSTVEKALKLAAIVREGDAGAKALIKTRCERGADIARQLGFPDATSDAISGLDEHFNGKGHPYGKAGDEIPLVARLAGIAQTVEVFHKNFGRNAAIEIARERSGRWFDPELVDVLVGISADAKLWKRLEEANWQAAVELEAPPEIVEYVDDDELDRICEGFAAVVDAKSPWTAKHSTRVADISVGIGEELGMSKVMLRDIRRAGLLHDLGKLGVSNHILDKPGRPTDEEFAEIQRHPDYSEQILRRIPLFDRLTDVAVSHHEKLDGSGYHQRIDGSAIPFEGRILAVADIYEALTADRPYRNSMPQEKVEAIMNSMLGPGICNDCYEALGRWRERTEVTSRVESQLEAIEKLHSELA